MVFFMLGQTPENNALAPYGNALLRAVVRENILTFPAQIPVFKKPPKGYIQQRAVPLYFVRGWSVRRICNRYSLAKNIVQDLLSDWRIRAISGGLIQVIEPEELKRFVLKQEPHERDGHLWDYQSALEFHPSLHAVSDNAATAASRLMVALEDDWRELSVELSRDQMRKIERIVRSNTRPDANPPRNLAETNGSGGRLGISGFQSQPELVVEREGVGNGRP
jgi:hypothetical protein